MIEGIQGTGLGTNKIMFEGFRINFWINEITSQFITAE